MSLPACKLLSTNKNEVNDGKKITSTFSEKANITESRPENIPISASLINLGSEDKPVFQWVDYYNVMNNNEIIYPHIYGFIFWEYSGSVIDTFYYEFDGSRNLEDRASFEGCKIEPYPGDVTLKVITNNSPQLCDTIYMFRVNGGKESWIVFENNSFKRLPTTNFNQDSIKVSGYDIYLSVVPFLDYYSVKIIGNGGVDSFKYVLEGNCDNLDIHFSYFDQTTRMIYPLDKNCRFQLIR